MLKSPPQITDGLSDIVVANVATASAIIPVTATGETAKYILVSVTSNPCYFETGDSGVTANTTTSIVLGVDHPYIFNVAGKTHFAYLQITGAGILSVSPLENQ